MFFATKQEKSTPREKESLSENAIGGIYVYHTLARISKRIDDEYNYSYKYDTNEKCEKGGLMTGETRLLMHAFNIYARE